MRTVLSRVLSTGGISSSRAGLSVLVFLGLLTAGVTAAAEDNPKVAVLVNHEPTGWSSGSGGTDGSLELVKCNLEVYSAAIATAASQGAKLLILPESYGLWGPQHKSGYWEPLSNATRPCTEADPNGHPAQHAMGCLAEQHGIALAYNIFSRRASANRITELVVSEEGRLLASYDKVHLAPIIEPRAGVTKGTNRPTSFEWRGRRWGIIICAEGVFPWTPGGNWDQMDALHRQNATNWLWSVGGMVPVAHVARAFAKRYGVRVATSQDATLDAPGVLICGGKEALDCPWEDHPVSRLPQGYTAAPFVRIAKLE